MGYWKDTIERWYQEGLPKGKDVTRGLKPGEGIRGENAPHDEYSLERRRDVDVHHYFGFDQGMVCLPVNSLLQPPFENRIFEETEDYVIFQDEFGVKKKMNKREASRPQYLQWPAGDRKGFEKLKERLKPSLKYRVPSRWKELIKQYKDRDYPLTLGGIPAVFMGPSDFSWGRNDSCSTFMMIPHSSGTS
jgi:uroporphyrinogen decarboxylase